MPAITRTVLLILFTLAAASGCAGIKTEPAERSSGDPPPAAEREYTTWRDLRAPLTGQFELPEIDDVVVAPSPRPRWMPGELPYWVWLAQPAEDVLLFLGSSFPLARRESELDRCIENAARQAARYAGIAAVVSSYRGSFDEGTGYAEDTRLFFNQNLIPTLIAEAELLALHQDAGGSYALVRFPSLAAVGTEADWSYLRRDGDEPRWISAPPAGDDAYIGIGTAVSRLRFADSIEAADESAVADILTQLATTVDVAYDIRREGDGGSSFIEENYQYSTALVRGVRIIARWRSPDGRYYYSLAMLPRNGRR